MGSQIEQLKNRAKEYAKAYHEKEVKRSVHKGEMEEILRQADWLMEQKFCFVTVGIWSHAVRYMKFHRFPGMPARTEIRNGYICSTGKSI